MRAIFYHGVLDRRRRLGSLDYLFNDTADFEAQVELIARRWQPMSLAEVHDHLVTGRALPERAVHISFDDGFRNTLTAAEILDRHRVPWTLFVVADAIRDGYVPWYVRLGCAVTASTNVRGRNGEVHDLSDAAAEWHFIHVVKAEVMAGPAGATDQVVDDVLSRPGMRQLDENPWPFLDTRELEELRVAGVEIGSHSSRHWNLVRCDDNELGEEVAGSRRKLEDCLGAPVRFFSYPDGRHSSRVRQAVGASYELAVTTWSWRQENAPLAMRRLGGPTTQADLSELLDEPKPLRLGLQSVRWGLPTKARETVRRLAPPSWGARWAP